MSDLFLFYSDFFFNYKTSQQGSDFYCCTLYDMFDCDDVDTVLHGIYAKKKRIAIFFCDARKCKLKRKEAFRITSTLNRKRIGSEISP
jgi:hypothetical protein